MGVERLPLSLICTEALAPFILPTGNVSEGGNFEISPNDLIAGPIDLTMYDPNGLLVGTRYETTAYVSVEVN